MQFTIPAEQAVGLAELVASHYEGRRADDPGLRVMITLGDGGVAAPSLVVAFLVDGDTNESTHQVNAAGTVDELI